MCVCVWGGGGGEGGGGGGGGGGGAGLVVKALLRPANFTLGPDATLNTEKHKNSFRRKAPNSKQQCFIDFNNIVFYRSQYIQMNTRQIF